LWKKTPAPHVHPCVRKKGKEKSFFRNLPVRFPKGRPDPRRGADPRARSRFAAGGKGKGKEERTASRLSPCEPRGDLARGRTSKMERKSKFVVLSHTSRPSPEEKKRGREKRAFLYSFVDPPSENQERRKGGAPKYIATTLASQWERKKKRGKVYAHCYLFTSAGGGADFGEGGFIVVYIVSWEKEKRRACI